MNLATDFISQVTEKAQYLDDEKKLLILQIIENFIPHDDWDDDELSENDLHHIRLGEEELANGTHGSWENIRNNSN